MSEVPFARPPFQITDKIGILDPNGFEPNPLTGQPYANLEQSKLLCGEPKTYACIARHIWCDLGVYKKRGEVLKLMNDKQIVCAKSGTGSGKTVIFPKFALHVGGYQKKVLCAIPKQIITKSSAQFAASTLDVRLGEEVGFFYKGDHNRSTKTLLTFTTTGSVNAIIKRDPLLSEYDYLVIDEAHERTVDMDMLLLFVKEMVTRRKDIKIVIMSATIDPLQYQEYFAGFSFGAVDIPATAPFPRVKQFPVQDIQGGTKNAVIEEHMVRIENGATTGALGRVVDQALRASDYTFGPGCSGYKCPKLADAMVSYGKMVAEHLGDVVITCSGWHHRWHRREHHSGLLGIAVVVSTSRSV